MPSSDLSARSLKSSFRKERLAARDALALSEREAKSAALVQHGLAHLLPFTGGVVAGFLPIRSEADIRPLMEAMRQAGVRLAIPAILDRETILFREYLADAPLETNAFGTVGPGSKAATLVPDLMLVPLAVFDGRGHRIGYGGGYYDRAIARLRACGHKPRLIGIAFDCQKVDEVPVEDHDISLDSVLTESGLHTCAAAMV